MLARYARRFLVFEFIFYGLVALLAYTAGLNGPASLVLVPVLALATRSLGVASTFLVAASLLTPAERGPSAGVTRLRMVAAEIFWTTLAYSVLMPFPRLAGSADSRLRAAPGAKPVLLVHGYVCNHGIWASLRRFLERNGVAAYAHDLEPVYAGIDDYVPALAARIDAVCDTSGAAKVTIVAHSMGGLVARAYLRAHGPARVAGLITLGSPHHGTRSAPLGLGENARQMRPGSAWLTALARDEATRGTAVPFTSIYSEDDNVVVPARTSEVQGQCNVRLAGIGHVSLVFAAPVQRQVLALLQSTPPARS